MSTLYKLTDENCYTRRGKSNETRWGENVTHTARRGATRYLCTSGVIHAYESPLLAALFNPIHTHMHSPLLWEAKGKIVVRDGQVKCGCVRLTTLRQVPPPEITIIQRVAWAILCARSMSDPPAPWGLWAAGWLSGRDRSADAARKAEVETAAPAPNLRSSAARECAAIAAARACAAETAAVACMYAAEAGVWRGAGPFNSHINLHAFAEQAFKDY